MVRRRLYRAVGALAAAVTLTLVVGCSAGPELVVQGIAAATVVRSATAAAAPRVRSTELAVAGGTTSATKLGDGPAVDPRTTRSLRADRGMARGRVATEVVAAGGYQTVGVTWDADSVAGAQLEPEIRTRTGAVWTEWTPLGASDSAPDAGTADDSVTHGAARTGSDTLWVGDVDAVQLSLDAAAVRGTSGIRLAVVGSDDSTSPAGVVRAVSSAARATTRVAALAASVMPTVVTRAQWGAAAPSCTMGVASSLVGAVLHHTADTNDYTSQAQAEAMIRNDQRYHMVSLGWCDLGYNFVVDKWGTIYEGRAGSLTSAVIGVHAGGFNTGTVGIAMLGSYGTVAPSATVVSSVAQVIGWKLHTYGVDPTGTMRYYTGEGQNSRYLDEWVTLPRVFGHRDVAYTACPGDLGYATLPAVRQQARAFAAPMFVGPTLSASSVPIGGSVTVRASTVGDIDWTLRVVDDRTGVTMYTGTGRAIESQGGASATWPGTGPIGTPVGPGPYRLELTGSGTTSGQPANSYSAVVQVSGSQDPPLVAAVPLVGNLTFVPIAPQRLLDTRNTGQSLGPKSRLDLTVAGVAGVPADAHAVALNVTAVEASGPTFIRAWPAGSTPPLSSLLNAPSAGAVAAGGVIAVGGEGKVSLYNDAGSVHLVVDVTGYYTDAAGSGSVFGQLDRSARLLDTRQAGAIAPGTSRALTVAGADGVPQDATAVVLNVVAVGAQAGGYVSVVPHGADPRATSTVNDRPGGDVANRATVPLAAGVVDVHVEGSRADVVIDIVGWYGPSGTLHLTPIAAERVLDTRSGSPVGPQSTLNFPVGTGSTSVPGARVAVATVTATQQTAPATFLTLWPAGQPRPDTSDLNTGSGRDQANMALLAWDASGEATVYNDQGSTHVVVDVYAFFG